MIRLYAGQLLCVFNVLRRIQWIASYTMYTHHIFRQYTFQINKIQVSIIVYFSKYFEGNENY